MIFKRIVSLILVCTALFQLFPMIVVSAETDEVIFYGTEESFSSEPDREEVFVSEDIVFVEKAPVYASSVSAQAVLTTDDGFTYEVLNGSYVGITGYLGESTEIVIPSEIDGYTVQQISAGAFAYNSVIETVTFPNTLERIDTDAFYEATALKKVNFSDSVTAIGRDAFARCTALTSVAFPASVKTIGQDAFSYCSALESIDYPVGWESVSGYSTPFEGCPKLTSITIPDGVTSIPAYAFSQMDSLESITLPESLTAIGMSAFAYCGSLKSIDLPAGITRIESTTFIGCKGLSSIDFHEGIVFIGEDAFNDCDGLTHVDFPESLTTLSRDAFSCCDNLESISYPVNWDSVGRYSTPFASCPKLTSITVPEGVTSIPAYAFSQMDSLESITLPESLTTIGMSAFAYCGSLKSIDLPLGITRIESTAFIGCKGLSSIDLHEGIVFIGDDAFNDCDGLTHVDFPASLTTLYGDAFSYCDNLESITYPVNWNSVGRYSTPFASCPKLTSITVPEGVTSIPEYAFDMMGSLENITLPESLTAIGMSAFAYCVNLTSVDLPDGITRIEPSTFIGCKGLSSIDLHEGIVFIGNDAFNDCDGLTHVDFPESLTTLSRDAFSCCDNLESISYPVNWDSVGRYSTPFASCPKLTSITIPEGVTAIPDYAFDGMSSLESITLPESLTSIGVSAFRGCKNLKSFDIPDGVTKIENYTFFECKGISSIDLHEGIEYIGSHAFSDCDGLVSLDFPESLTTILTDAFSYCDNLSSINYPVNWTSALRYGSPFANCPNITSIIIPEGVTEIPAYAFGNMTGLKQINIPESVTEIGKYAFENCDVLTEIDLPENLVSIGAGAFSRCDNLTRIEIPGSVTALSMALFINCTSLTDVVLSEGLESIGDDAFNDCPSLTRIYIPNSVTYIDETAFRYTENVTFYCNKNSAAGVFAVGHGIPLVNMGGSVAKTKYLSSDSAYEVNMEGVSASGYLSMICKYSFEDDVTVKNCSLVFYIPDNAELIDSSVTLDGVLCVGYTYDNGVLTLPVEKTQGTVRFYLKPMTYDLVTTYAQVHFYNGTYAVTETINVVYAEQPVLSCTSVNETSSAKVTVKGVTVPGNTVYLYFGGKIVATAVANKAGDYTATVSLGTPSDGKKYTVTAKTQNRAGEELTASTSVIYREGAPELLSFVMEHLGQKMDLMTLGNVKPIVTFAGGRTFKFTVKFDLPQNVDKVYIVSNRGNVKKVMTATWDEKTKSFVAEGFFDENDRNYVPGTISVEYSRKSGKVSFSDAYDFTSDAAKESISEKWRDAEVTVTEETENSLNASIILPSAGIDLPSASVGYNIVGKVTAVDNFDASYAKENGYTRVVDDDGNVGFARYYQDPGGRFVYDVYDPIKGELISYGIDAVSGEVSTAFGFYDTIMDGAKYDMEYRQMLEDIENSNLTPTQKKAMREEIEKAMVFNEAATVIKLVGGAAKTLFPTSPTVRITVAIVETVLDILQEYTQYNLMKKMFDLQSFGQGFKWAIDPSGYVYDSETNVRIPGVKATLYYRPTMEDDPIVWDAGEYSQLNPLYTDADGCYAWDVPEGYWQVMYEHEDYETAYSEWLLVPPPQTDVNIAMTPLPKLVGDVNGDKTVNSDDAVAILRHLAGYDSTGYDIANGDFNSDGTTNSDDAVAILRMLAGYND